MERTKSAVADGLAFVNSLEQTAAANGVSRGTLGRWLLPEAVDGGGSDGGSGSGSDSGGGGSGGGGGGGSIHAADAAQLAEIGRNIPPETKAALVDAGEALQKLIRCKVSDFSGESQAGDDFNSISLVFHLL